MKLLNQISPNLVFLGIMVLAIIFRFSGVNWDDNTHLHPDERFLTMVGIDTRIPKSFSDYLNPKASSLNPVNLFDNEGNRKYPFYVYGALPLTLTKIIAAISDNDNYNGFTITGRLFSAFLDLLVVMLIFKTIELLEKKLNLNGSIKYLASFFYTISVLPIQLSHFFAVDTFLSTFIFASFYFCIRFYVKNEIHSLMISGIFLGFAMASKITAVFYLPLALSIISICIIKQIKFSGSFKNVLNNNKNIFLYFFICLFVFLATTYLSLRISNPYMFENSSFLNPEISKLLVQNWRTLKSWESEDAWFPPAVQWLNRPPVFFSLFNLILFGVGIPYFLFILSGFFKIFAEKRNIIFTIILLWVVGFFLYQSVQPVKAIRYFIFIYPFLAIFAALGWDYLLNKQKMLFKLICLALVLIWPLSFISIYINPHSRIQASEWIYDTIPAGSTIAWEVWDDPLPLRLPNQQRYFNLLELHIFNPDSTEKWKEVNNVLSQSDYYILSSNRAWESISRVPERYPLTSKFYNELFVGKRGFIKVAEFNSYPSLNYLGIPIIIPDNLSEESFTVYDHPKVLIFKNVRR